ncbi:hypothetical protein ABMA28_004079 [Loxostege sticticalis]|uniref:Elongation of very long chain fatty acids protein n=1 Tax=Loxostege sticticalis TaxID=481309 RepID=A0ABD0SU87_LOXSC
MKWCFHTSLVLPRGQLNFVEQWPLMNPNELLFILVSYLLFVLKIGPILMEGRPPVQIKGFLIFYNLFKVINSAVLTYTIFSYIIDNGLFPRKCEHDVLTLHFIASVYWKYMITKILDFFDTIFFVIRKKYNQVTFLHVYHHTFMVVMTWICLKYDPSDHWAFLAFVNCVTHTIMYLYYAVAAMGPRFAKYLWWKKYLTMMQLIQFVLVIGVIVIKKATSECPIHTSLYWISLANLVLFIWLFVDFYNKRYGAKGSVPVGLACTKQVTE